MYQVNLPYRCQPVGERISVVGTAGVGKTTVAREISQRLGFPHIELDALFWEGNWQEVPDDVFRARVWEAVKDDRWVVDGNYSRTRDLVWGRADTVVYLDYAFGRIFWQLINRTIQRTIRKDVLWNGNREDLKKSFFSKDSILYWMMTTYHRRQKQYRDLFQQPEYAHLRVVHLDNPWITKEWLLEISQIDRIKKENNGSTG